MRNNGHNDLDSRTHEIGSRIVMPDGKRFSASHIPSNGQNPNRAWAKPHSEMAEPIDFRAFSDGTIVDLLRDPGDERPRFLVWKSGQAAVRNDFHYADRSFVPPHVEVALMRAIRLPIAITADADVGDLLQNLRECILTYIDLQPQSVRLVSNFILYTWFADRLTVAPYLWVTGPYGAGKTKLLRLLHCLCRRALLSSDMSSASFYLLPSLIMPTLLIDEFDSGTRSRHQDVLRFLLSGSTQGGHVFRGGKPYDSFCAKVIASRQGPSDTALASRAVSVSMLPTHRELPELGSAAQERIANQFQGQLLSYRLHNYFGMSAAIQPDFTARMKDIARSLLTPLLGHRRLEQQLVEDLRPQDQEAELSRHNEPEWAVATALYKECHRTNGVLTVGTLTSCANELLATVGETYWLKPRGVGSLVRSLGLQTCKVGNLGRGLRMTRELKTQVHRLANDLGIRRSDVLNYQAVDAGYAGLPCTLCEKYGLLVQEDGTKLRTLDPLRTVRDKPRPPRDLFGRARTLG
jgi:hypothetical protein